MVKSFNPETDFDASLKVISRISDMLREQKEVQEYLDFDQVRDRIRQTVLDYLSKHSKQKQILTDAQINKLIDNVFEDKYAFPEPAQGFEATLASMYIDRQRIWKSKVIPKLKIAAAAAVLAAVVQGGIYVANLAAERNLEMAIESSYQQLSLVQQQANDIKQYSPTRKTFSSASLDIAVKRAEERLNGARTFFDIYCKNGTAEDDVTLSNYRDAKNQLSVTKESINKAKEYVLNAQELIKIQSELEQNKESLDATIEAIRSISIHGSVPLKFVEGAEIAYKNGVAYNGKDQLSESKNALQKLVQIQADIKEFSGLPDKAEKLYNSIINIAEEQAAKNSVESLNNEAKSYISTANIGPLKETLRKMEQLETSLNQEYEIVLVTRQGVKSGIERSYEDDRGKRVSGYYLLLEAKDKHGNVFGLDVLNEEDGKTFNVNMWGERVPREVYERVKADKVDNGIINSVNNKNYGQKQRGYLNAIVTMTGVDGIRLKRQGQITNWTDD